MVLENHVLVNKVYISKNIERVWGLSEELSKEMSINKNNNNNRIKKSSAPLCVPLYHVGIHKVAENKIYLTGKINSRDISILLEVFSPLHSSLTFHCSYTITPTSGSRAKKCV